MDNSVLSFSSGLQLVNALAIGEDADLRYRETLRLGRVDNYDEHLEGLDEQEIFLEISLRVRNEIYEITIETLGFSAVLKADASDEPIWKKKILDEAGVFNELSLGPISAYCYWSEDIDSPSPAGVLTELRARMLSIIREKGYFIEIVDRRPFSSNDESTQTIPPPPPLD